MSVKSRVADQSPTSDNTGWLVQVKEFDAEDEVVSVLYPDRTVYTNRDECRTAGKLLAGRYKDLPYEVVGS